MSNTRLSVISAEKWLECARISNLLSKANIHPIVYNSFTFSEL